MGVVHHSNYIRYLEEARCTFLEKIGLSFAYLEENGITIPVLGVNVEYKFHVTFSDIVEIHVYIKDYNGVRMNIGYEILEKETKKKVLSGETKHCFTNRELRPINLKSITLKFIISLMC